MKKTIALILGIILVLSLTACGKSAEKEKTVYQRGDTVTLKNWEIPITDFQFFDFSDKEEHPEEKGIEVNCTVKNIGKKEETFFSSGFWLKKDNARLLYGNGYEYEATYIWFNDSDLRNAEIIPLSTRSGTISFRVPQTVADSQEELLFKFSSGLDSFLVKLR